MSSVNGIIESILEQTTKYGRMMDNFSEDDFGKYALTGLGPDTKYRVGRLVQVRLEAGMLGSDKFLLRHLDDTLMVHENQSLFVIDAGRTSQLALLFSSVYTIRKLN